MDNLNIGGVLGIALLLLVIVSFTIGFIRNLAASKHAAPPEPAPAPSPSPVQAGPAPTSAAALMSEIINRSHSQSAFDQYIADHTPDQLDDVPVYAMAHIITASIQSVSRAKWFERVMAAVVPRGADPELIHTADYFWDVNEKWLFSQTAFADFCNEYLIANKSVWSSAVHERIVLAGYTALASRDKEEGPASPDMMRDVSEFMSGLDMVAEAYFGAEAGQVRSRLLAEAERLAPVVRADMA